MQGWIWKLQITSVMSNERIRKRLPVLSRRNYQELKRIFLNSDHILNNSIFIGSNVTAQKIIILADSFFSIC